MLDRYQIELKDMKADSAKYEFTLDDQFFADLDAPEVQKGNLKVELNVRKTAGIYLLEFETEGTVIIPCDRCLDDMEQPISTSDRLKVKLGEEYSEEGDMVIVPEEEGYIDISWFVYEFIALNIPIKHVHAHGECNEDIMGKLKKHLRVAVDEEGEDDDDELLPDDEDDSTEGPREIDPRWSELKKILDNN